MYKYFLILLLISLELFAMKIRIKQKDNITTTKIMLINNMIGEVVGKRKNLIADYITNVKVKADNKNVYNIFMSPYISKNPFLQFQCNNCIKAKNIEIFTTDNNGKQKIKNININTITTNSNVSDKLFIPTKYSLKNIAKDSKLWNATTPKQVIKELTNSSDMINGKIFLKVPKLVESWLNMPISIKSNLNLESIYVLMTNNPHSLVAIFEVPKDTVIDYKIRIKAVDGFRIIIDNSGQFKATNLGTDIIVIGKTRDGKLYKVMKHIIISPNAGTAGTRFDDISGFSEMYESQDK